MRLAKFPLRSTNLPSGRTRLVAALFAALGVVGAACSSNSTSSTVATTPTTRPSTAVEIHFGSGQVGPSVPSTTVPVERGTRPINCANDAGQQIIIAKGGYLCPQWLIAEIQLPIIWTNLSGAPQQIIFNDAPVRTAVIAPGGTFTWHSPPYAVGINYHTGVGHQGHLQLQNPSSS